MASTRKSTGIRRKYKQAKQAAKRSKKARAKMRKSAKAGLIKL